MDTEKEAIMQINECKVNRWVVLKDIDDKTASVCITSMLISYYRKNLPLQTVIVSHTVIVS